MSSDNKLKVLITEAVQEALVEGIVPKVRVVVNGQEVPFGDGEHLEELYKTYEGLSKVRDSYPKGSGVRQTYSHACTRLRKLLETISKKSTVENS